MKQTQIAILGYGKVAKQFAKILEAEQEFCGIFIKAILVRNIERYKTEQKYEAFFTTDYGSILKDDTIDTVVELIGGMYPAYQYVKTALEHKKNVVTTNRPLIAHHYEELNQLANLNGKNIRYEGSVGCGIPIIQYLSQIEPKDIIRINALVNSACNVIFTKTFEENLMLEDAIRYAVKNNFTERNWREDTDGLDTAEKMTILLSTLFHNEFPVEAIDVDCEFHFTDQDIETIKGQGFRLKQLGCVNCVHDGYEARVGFYVVEKHTLLGSIFMNTNYINVEFEDGNHIGFHGKGVSPFLTATAVYADIKQINNQLFHNITRGYRLIKGEYVDIWIRISSEQIELSKYKNLFEPYVRWSKYLEAAQYCAFWLYQVPYEVYIEMKELLYTSFTKEKCVICRIL